MNIVSVSLSLKFFSSFFFFSKREMEQFHSSSNTIIKRSLNPFPATLYLSKVYSKLDTSGGGLIEREAYKKFGLERRGL